MLEEIRHIGVMIGVAISIIGGAAGVVGTIYWAAVRFARVEFKVDAMWEVTMHKGFGSLMAKNLVAQNSPMHPTEAGLKEILRVFPSDLVEDLRQYYWDECRDKNMTDHDLGMLISSRFIKRINNAVNIPNPKMDLEECLAMAVLIAKVPAGKIDSDEVSDKDTMIAPP